MKAMIATSFNLMSPPSSKSFFRFLSDFSHFLSSNICNNQQVVSLLKTMNSLNAPSSIGVQQEFSNFSKEATLKENVEESIRVPSCVPVSVAHELLVAGHRYLDVRTPEEFSTGHVSSAINIPYMYKVGSGMTKNSDFLAQVSSHFRKDDNIIVGCQLGKRSTMAAADLLAVGFSGVRDIVGGYVAWTQNGLPTDQSCEAKCVTHNVTCNCT